MNGRGAAAPGPMRSSTVGTIPRRRRERASASPTTPAPTTTTLTTRAVGRSAAPGGGGLAGGAADRVRHGAQASLGDRLAAVQADPVRAGRDRLLGDADLLLAPLPAELGLQLALAGVGVRRGLGRVVVAVASLLGRGRVLAEPPRHRLGLLTQPGE